MTRNQVQHAFAALAVRFAILLGIALVSSVGAQNLADTLQYGTQRQVDLRSQAIIAYSPHMPSDSPRIGSMSPAERRAAIDAYWGDGLSTAEKLKIFDTYWEYADRKFAAFQNLVVDWPALRQKYRAEIAAGVSRGRFAGIMNHLALQLRDSHTQANDILVNYVTVPGPGVPSMGQGAWEVDTSGACLTAQDDGSALVYSALPNHPLGLQRGDRILGYDGKPWRELYQELINEEVPMWPLWWGTSPSSFDHSFVMSAGLNWHLFEVMDIAKQSTGQVVHVSTSLMPGDIFWGFCSEQINVPGVPKPNFFAGNYVRSGIVTGTNIGYIYVWGWTGTAETDFANAVYQLTQVNKVAGLIVDYRFNVGGFLRAPFLGTAILAERPAPTLGNDQRLKSDDHFLMKTLLTPDSFNVDFLPLGRRDVPVKLSYAGPVAVLVGPGAVSAGDFGSELLRSLPIARTFGKSTSMALGLPTQPALGTHIDLGPDWDARVSESNSYAVGRPQDFLIHTEFPVDQPVWLTPQDVAVGQDTVVNAAMKWLKAQIGE
jgi:C-terminal processing protease CtpA/Prc